MCVVPMFLLAGSRFSTRTGISAPRDRKSTRLNSSHANISYAVFCLNDPATTEIYTLSLHDALPICIADLPRRQSFFQTIRRQRARRLPDVPFDRMQPVAAVGDVRRADVFVGRQQVLHAYRNKRAQRSEEHTSELQSRQYLVCRLLFE